MFGAILKATNNSFQICMIFCRSIYVKKVMKLLAFIFEQPSYVISTVISYADLYDYSIGYRIIVTYAKQDSSNIYIYIYSNV